MKSSNDTSQVWSFVTIVLLVGLSAVILLLVRTTLPTSSHMTYAKYGCIPDDSSKRDWDQYMGLSTCR